MGNCNSETPPQSEVKFEQKFDGNEQNIPIKNLERKLEESQIKLKRSQVSVVSNKSNKSQLKNHFQETDDYTFYKLDPEEFVINQQVQRLRDKLGDFQVDPTFSQEHGSNYDTLVKFQYEDHYMVYKGEWKDQKAHGLGIVYFGDGSYYQGFFFENMMHGYGRLVKPMQTYEGMFHMEKFHGRGKLRQIGEYNYEGEFQDGQFFGEGKLENVKENVKYEGCFFKNVKQGYGTEWNNGTKYEGNFKDGVFHTEGVEKSTLTWLNENKVYVGQFQNGQQEGQGITTYSSGKQYTGPYLQGLRHGVGKFVHQNQNKNLYIGMFVQGTQQGEGKQVQLKVSTETITELGSSELGSQEREKRSMRMIIL